MGFYGYLFSRLMCFNETRMLLIFLDIWLFVRFSILHINEFYLRNQTENNILILKLQLRKCYNQLFLEIVVALSLPQKQIFVRPDKNLNLHILTFPATPARKKIIVENEFQKNRLKILTRTLKVFFFQENLWVLRKNARKYKSELSAG